MVKIQNSMPQMVLLCHIVMLAIFGSTLFYKTRKIDTTNNDTSENSDDVLIETTTSTATSSKRPSSLSPYRIIIDGGSTGSRLHIFEFTHDSSTNSTACIRRGSTKANIPLSHFGSPSSLSSSQKPRDVAQHLLPLFHYASDIIPPQYHSKTQVTYQATAGMRLLDFSSQEAVYDALYLGLKTDPTFVFESMKREDIATMSGEVEAFYGAVAANYLKGMIDVRLHIVVDDDNDDSDSSYAYGYDGNSFYHMGVDDTFRMIEEGNGDTRNKQVGPLGALDMGGASMQIVFLPPSDQNEDENDIQGGTCDTQEQQSKNFDPNEQDQPYRMVADEFYSTSYLSYGVDQFRERLWDAWIYDATERKRTISTTNPIIQNPCSFSGYKMEWKGFSFEGTGDSTQCINEINRLIPHDTIVLDDLDVGENMMNANVTRRTIGGVEHPPVTGKFVAMSLFFFTLDCLRELSRDKELNLSWPTPTINELVRALDGLCSRNWHGDLKEIQHNAHGFTRAEVLPDRCFESVYLVTLLKDGFGFHPTSNDITFAFDVNGSEVEWTLGMALSKFSEEENPVVSLQRNSVEIHENNADTTDETDANYTESNDPDDDAALCMPLTFLSDVAPSHWMIQSV